MPPQRSRCGSIANRVFVLLTFVLSFSFAADPSISRVTLEECIGEGAVSRVYKGTLSSVPNAKVAIKAFRRVGTCCNDGMANSVQAISREISVLQRIADSKRTDPYILKYHGAYRYGDQVLLVLSYALGDVMGMVMELEAFPKPVQRSIVADVAHGLLFLHSLNVIHRDVKPENILISLEGRAMIADFNACYVGAEPGKHDAMICHDIMGTPEWVPVEVVQGKRGGYNQKADTWGLGCVAYAMALTRFPFKTAAATHDPESILAAITSTVLLYDKLTKIDPRLTQFVRRALDFDPNTRASIAECLGLPWLSEIDEPELGTAWDWLKANSAYIGSDISSGCKYDHDLNDTSGALSKELTDRGYRLAPVTIDSWCEV